MGLVQRDDCWYIRANQGHSISSVKTEALLTKIHDPKLFPLCVHGTYMKHWDSIKRSGLKRMDRKHIHFTPGDKVRGENKVTSGFRGSSNLFDLFGSWKSDG
eukprot:TRINITY_DN10894_c0_g1_i1.p1 TRINITY_DN10894_c0_g1~~TRINITY_DN10894_c0_g1_i1.p1  ORF type:complete len:102 (+),score=13.37 TRINITY_DN10894_c0_g1_i1:142-447(+)